MIRKAELLINTSLLYQLRVLSELDGLGCTENVAELILGEALSRRPELAEIAKAEQAAKKQAREDVLKKYGKHDDKQTDEGN